MSSVRVPRLVLPALAAAALVVAGCTASTSGAGAGPRAGAGPTASSPRPPGSTGPTVITPAHARGLVSSTMSTNNRANKDFDSKLLATYESGSAFVLDNSTYRQDRLAVAAKDPLAAYQPFGVTVSSVGVERQPHYPAAWVAIGEQKPLAASAPKPSQQCDAVLAFDRASSAGRWRIALEPTIPAVLAPKLASAPNGYEAVVPAAHAEAARALPNKLVAAFMAEETSGRQGPFRSADFTRACGAIPNPRSDVLGAEQKDGTARDVFSVTRPADTAYYAVAGGATLVLFTLDFVDQIGASSSAPIEWSHAATKASPASPETYLLPAGSYSQLTEKGQLEMALVMSKDTKTYSVIGSYAGVLSITGIKAPSTPTSQPHGTLTAWEMGHS